MSRLGKNGLSRVGRGRVNHAMLLDAARYAYGTAFLPDSDEAFTLCAWVNRLSTGSVWAFTQMESDGLFTGFRWRIRPPSTGGPAFPGGPGRQDFWGFAAGGNEELIFHVEDAIGDHTWNHYALTKASGSRLSSAYTAYFNGQNSGPLIVEVEDPLTTTWLAGTAPTRLGGYGPGTHGNAFADGAMKNAIAFDSELSAGDIAAIYALGVDATNEALPASPLCRYRMDDPDQAVGTLVDSSGNGRDMTLDAGSASYIRGGSRELQPKLAIQFDGSQHYRIADDAAFRIHRTSGEGTPTTLSVSMWVKRPTGGNGYFFSCLDASVLGWGIDYNSGTAGLHLRGSGGVMRARFAMADEFQHVVFTKGVGSDFTDATAYVNGSEVALTNENNTLSSGDIFQGVANVAARSDGSLIITTAMAHVSVYVGTELSLAQVQQLHSIGPIPTPRFGPTGHWNFNDPEIVDPVPDLSGNGHSLTLSGTTPSHVGYTIP